MPRLRYLTTHINLPPGCPSGAVIREFLRLVFEEYGWFAPRRYGYFATWNQKLALRRIDYDALIALYEEKQSLSIAARTDSDFICIFRVFSTLSGQDCGPEAVRMGRT